jgi:glycine dehydrogenase subunit 1
MPFIPHTEADVREMLAAIGAPDIEALFDEIPPGLRVQSLAGIPAGLNEQQVMRLMHERARRDGLPLNFIGAGAYEHHIPAAVWAIVTRGEFYSAYTPYQAEASQGTLQTIYEYQSMITALTGMQVANASLYDGATAVAEACLMAVRAHRRSKSARILVPATVNPSYRSVAHASTRGQGLHFEPLAFVPGSGQVALAALEPHAGSDVTAVVIQQPNFFGVLEDVDALTDWAHAQGALVIAVVNPTSLAVLKPPGEWGAKGADIVIGDGQPLGCPLSSGGPYFGFMATRMEFVRQMPGRIVGRTVDLDGRPGFTLTLQAREQHIRRGKATSNICTNQGLLMVAGTLYLAMMGSQGLERVARACMARTEELVAALTKLPGVRRAFPTARFHEAVLLLDRPVAPVLEALADRGIEGGFDLARHYPELGPALLVCATEARSSEDVAAYAAALQAVLASQEDTPRLRHSGSRS